MDPSEYKEHRTNRGYTYQYFYAAPEGEKPTLLLLHGFPNSSIDWRFVVAFFKQKGYGFVVPDLLGYSGTDKPLDPGEYRLKLMAEDIVEILDSEDVKRVISVGHDWGCGLNSRLANYYQDRIEAFGFFASSYFPPSPDGFNVDSMNEASEKQLGYRYLGYWKFFDRDDAAQIIDEHRESFVSVAFAKDPNVTRDHYCPDGQLYKWLTTDQRSEIADYVPQEIMTLGMEIFKTFSFKAPVCWYKAVSQGYVPKDDAEIPRENYTIKKPVFFGATLRDPLCPSGVTRVTMAEYAPNRTVVDFDTSHWVLMEAPDKVNVELQKWLLSLGN